jgi:integrase
MAHGISLARWQNIRSLVRAALALMGPIAPGRHLGGLKPDWAALYLQLPDRPLRSGLSRLFHHCSATGIPPSRFDRAAFDGFVESLGNSLLKDPAGTVRTSQRAWAKARSLIPDWPAVDIQGSASGAARTYALPWTDFQASLVTDIRKWLSRLGTPDLLDDGDFMPVRPRTLATREAELRRFVSAVVLSGQDITTLCSLADVVNPKVVKIGLQFHLTRRCIERGGEAPSDLASTAGVLLAIARHWARSPPEHIAEISRMVRRLRPRRVGMTRKNRDRLRPFDNPEVARKLIDLPQLLMCKADSSKRPAAGARLAAHATAIELLLVAPMRLANLAALDIDRHLVQPKHNAKAMTVVIHGSEVKNGRDLEYPLPERTVRLLKLYCDRFRPVLAGAESTALFPGRGGKPMEAGGLSRLVAAEVRAHLGLAVHVHLFRHITAKLYLDQFPGDLETVRRALGHDSTASTAAFYTGLDTPAALRYFDAVVLGHGSRRS